MTPNFFSFKSQVVALRVDGGALSGPLTQSDFNGEEKLIDSVSSDGMLPYTSRSRDLHYS